MWPPALPVLNRLFEALTVLRDSKSEVMQRLRVHFIGTGKSAMRPEGQIKHYIARFGVANLVDEHPTRIGYLDVLYHLTHSSAVLVIGSTAPHYSPSKIYQAIQSRRPVFAILHERSSAVGVLRETQAGCAVTISEHSLPTPEQLASVLAGFVSEPRYDAQSVRWSALEAYSARESARSLANAVELALRQREAA